MPYTVNGIEYDFDSSVNQRIKQDFVNREVPNWIPFYIECYNRMLFVEIIEGDVEEAKQILTDRYEDWVDGGPCEVCDVCCEEYMLEGLNNEKFIFSVGYGEEIQ